MNLYKNTAELREVELTPYYLNNYKGTGLSTEVFGQVYDAPFGIAQIVAVNICFDFLLIIASC